MDKRTRRGYEAARWVREHRGWMRLFWAMHRFGYRLTGGKLANRVNGNPVLLLTTTGRKSGQPRSVTLTYFPDGGNFVVVASNGAQDYDPAWWLNLKNKPRANVQVGNRKLTVNAEEATGADRERLWSMITRADPQYAGYEKLTKRPIPVVVLQPEKK
jgi:F420H(2)-dependent quinone reductase